MTMEENVPERVAIRPGIGLYALFPSLRYTPWVALGEMVDNSIQSYQEHKDELIALHGADYKLRIDLNLMALSHQQKSVEIFPQRENLTNPLTRVKSRDCEQRTDTPSPNPSKIAGQSLACTTFRAPG